MKNVLNRLQDSKREMEEKLNQAITDTKSYAELVENAPTSEKYLTTIGKNIDLSTIMEETKNAKLIEKKEKKLDDGKHFFNITNTRWYFLHRQELERVV